jgi:hypothetical protein
VELDLLPAHPRQRHRRLRPARQPPLLTGGSDKEQSVVGLIVNFVMHSVFGDYAAKTIGWAQSPFQLELAFASLGLGIAAVMVHGRRSPFLSKAALLIAFAVFGFGAAGGHVYQMIANHDFAANNAGLLLVNDFLVNTVAVVLIVWHAIATRRSRRDAVAPSTSSAPAMPVVL